MANVYYLNAIQDAPDRHQILAVVPDADVPTFNAGTLNPAHSVFFIEEIAANRADLMALASSLTAVWRPPAPKPVPWQYKDVGMIRRGDGTIWTPATSTERTEFLTNLNLARLRLAGIRDNAAAYNNAQLRDAVSDLALIQLRVINFVVRSIVGNA